MKGNSDLGGLTSLDAAEASPPIFPDRLWHARVHKAWGEHLYFWRLSFVPTYLRDSAVAGLKAALDSCSVRSLAAYEMFGVYDLLLRVWLANGAAQNFHDQLVFELSPHGLRLCEPFAVRYEVCHWAFPAEPSEAEAEGLRANPAAAEALEGGDATNDQIRSLEERNLLWLPKRNDDSSTAIKFALILAGEPEFELTPDERDEFEIQVKKIVRSAEGIQRSLYTGSGFGHFVILGRIEGDAFHLLQSKLVSQLLGAPLRERFHCMTTTLVSGQRGLLHFSENVTRSPWPPAGASLPVSEARLPASRGHKKIARRFEVLEELGTGGFSVVYRVWDSLERVERALKLFAPTGDSAAQRELAMLRRVSHPNVVRMYWGDRDDESRCWYLVSEFIEGEPLETFVRGSRAGELSDDQAVEILRQVLAGLEGLHPDDEHDGRMAELVQAGREGELAPEEFEEWQSLVEQGVVHRDIKPANIMIAKGGRVKLIDFNIASRARSPIETHSGTELYRPPVAIPIGTWEPQIDLFSAGVLFYELLCKGEHPYPGGVQGMVDPEEHRNDLSAGMRQFLMTSCAIPPAGFSTARQMRGALERAWSNMGVGDRGSPRVAWPEPLRSVRPV